MATDLGTLLLQTCVTLNGGAVVGFPTFYKALAPSDAPVSQGFLIAFISFAIGVALAGIGVVIAFLTVTTASRMTVAATLLPMLEAREALLPAGMDGLARKQLRQARRGARWAVAVGISAQVSTGVLGALSITSFIVGGFYGERAVSALVTHPAVSATQPTTVPPVPHLTPGVR
ncbi:hypothetical protein [Acidisphaera sp. L21]|uniref:hypothetical protein n=1 Tax=Acidisphaera sp. L21 TaxID=1641851 RepID=UPI00131DAE09|nr:hypothetical protein [Acidisphaera sp. L21]